jgi:hypothetical protein
MKNDKVAGILDWRNQNDLSVKRRYKVKVQTSKGKGPCLLRSRQESETLKPLNL